MLTISQALEIVMARLREVSPADDPFAVVEARTIEKPFGWVFFYNSKKFIETGASRYRITGNGPVIVNKHTGDIKFYGGNEPIQIIIREYSNILER